MNEKKSCKYCSSGNAKYQKNHHTKIGINTLGQAQALTVECNPCPIYANCVLKDNAAFSAFIINYCPNCGRKLGG